MSEIYVVVPKTIPSLKPTLPAHTTFQGAAMELATIPVVTQGYFEVVNLDLIDDKDD